KLEVNGIFAPAIKEPTVPKNTARIRFSLHAGLSKEDLKKVVELL
ncbi:pyridoxal phosphate-dependent aminotransferase family protein, partial [Campylobacter coli]|nr:pyridoxal phosphate-dependent aminotransferase family protein [Campylobacter coli]